MRAATIVYISLFILLSIPLIGFGIKALRDKKIGRNRRITTAFACFAGWVALIALCLALYHVTINSQPLLVIERFAQSFKASTADNAATLSGLKASGLADQGLGDVGAFADAVKKSGGLKISRISNEDDANFYLLIDEAGSQVALMTVQPSGIGVNVAKVELLSPEDGAKAIKESNFIDID